MIVALSLNTILKDPVEIKEFDVGEVYLLQGMEYALKNGVNAASAPLISIIFI